MMEWIGIVILFILLLIVNRDQKKLKRRMECNHDMITELWRIENERLLKK